MQFFSFQFDIRFGRIAQKQSRGRMNVSDDILIASLQSAKSPTLFTQTSTNLSISI